ncbi:MAG: hypothetical protein DI539_15780 [Flavobacterium psychrophilum]|nr:MAG: hypothetical protein DI539_15780 [Flavobacterium psychrophilum]
MNNKNFTAYDLKQQSVFGKQFFHYYFSSLGLSADELNSLPNKEAINKCVSTYLEDRFKDDRFSEDFFQQEIIYYAYFGVLGYDTWVDVPADLSKGQKRKFSNAIVSVQKLLSEKGIDINTDIEKLLAYDKGLDCYPVNHFLVA